MRSNMRKIEFSHDWTCRCLREGSKEIQVTLPHDAMISEKRSAQSLGLHNIGWFEAQDYVYTKHFQLSQQYEDKRIIFEIEGAYHNAEVYLNGKRAAYRPYGYSDFFVETDGFLKPGEENVIQIYTYNSDQPNSRWYTGTGLYRPVNMYVGGTSHILVNGVKIKTIGIAPAKIEVELQTQGVGEARIQIMGENHIVAETRIQIMEENHIVSKPRLNIECIPTANEKRSIFGKALVQLEIPDARLWNVDTPYLYQCKVIFDEDEVTENFGVRLLQWNTQTGITINHKRIILRGACIHHDNGVLGACAYPEAEERKIRILKENGYNAVRSAHNPCSKAMLDACDRLGVLMMDEYVDVWYIHKTEHDYAKYMENWWMTDLKEMVEKDYNHPCVILYSTGNEVAETAQKRGIYLTREMTEYLHSLDATRPVTCGINIFFNFLSSIGLGVYSNKKAKKELEKSQKNITNVKKKKTVGSEFYNTLAGLLGDDMMKVGATLYPCDARTRDAYQNMDIAGYNYGIFCYKKDLKKYPNRLIVGSETFCKDAYSFWEQAKKNPRIVGDFVWAGMDYIGEAGIGAWEYRDYAPENGSDAGWLTAGSGRIDLLGYANGEAFYTKVAFEQTEHIFIAAKPVYQTGKHSPSAWKMTDAIPSWSYHGCQGYQAKVEVYGRAYEVELLLNGKSIGRKRMKKNCVAYFNTNYENGRLTAVAYDALHHEITRTSLQTANNDTKLSIISEEKSVKPEGLIFLQLIYTDSNGIWKPMEKHRVQVTVKSGKLIGLGNACSYNKDGFSTNETKTYYGRALAVVQADGTGAVCVTVKDEIKEYIVTVPCF